MTDSLSAYYIPHTLHFKKPSGTSRGVLHERKTWYLVIYQKDNPQVRGVGECAPLKGLSVDDRSDFETVLKKLCGDIYNYPHWMSTGLRKFPSIKFGLETALLDFCNGGKRILHASDFTRGKDFIRTNGLIWMSDFEGMKKQVKEKIADNFRCIKLKIGAIDFKKELALLQLIRERHTAKKIEIRVDANGAFSPKEALNKLEQLSQFDIHSIEQPIRHGQRKAMRELCKQTPVPIALDEELIGIKTKGEKNKLLDTIQPQYIILKPTLVGGFTESLEWIKAANERNIGWWITSALESNIGLNAISQWTYTLGNKMPQGLGTGKLFTNNFESPLYLKSERLFFDPKMAEFPAVMQGKPEQKKLKSFIEEWKNSDSAITARTSGTTGTPKTIELEKNRMLQSALMTLRFLNLQPTDNALLCLSPEHIAGKMMTVRSIAGLLNLIPVEPSANPLKAFNNKQEIHLAAFVPLQVKEILKNKTTAKKFVQIKNVLIGGAPASPELRKQLSKLKNNIYETYGMTETISHVALKKISGKLTDYFETLPGISVKRDKRGCLVINAPALVAEPIITNDLVELKDKHHFKWLGRIDNVINSGGVKIIPELLEEKIKSLIHQRFYFAGTKDNHLGEKLVLAIEGNAYPERKLTALKQQLGKALGKYEVPREIMFLAKFQESSAGKIKRTLNQ